MSRLSAERGGFGLLESLGYKPVKVNPRPIRSVEDVREILELAW